MKARSFAVSTQAYGDQGYRPFVHVKCRSCGSEDRMNVSAGVGRILPDKEITKKLEAKGWEIASNGADICPACLKQQKEQRKTIAMNKNVIAMQPAAAANSVRAPSRDDQRIIFEKLGEVYYNEATGYTQGWSDQKVATDLGVPRKWVEDIREQFFGPIGTNPEMSAFVKEYEEVIAVAKPALDDARRLRDEVDKLVASPVWNLIPQIADRLHRLEREAEKIKKLMP